MDPVISKPDYQKLKKIIKKEKSRETPILIKYLKKLRIVTEREISRKTIRINSLVFVWHSLLKKIIRIRIVWPSKANLYFKNVSVFAPIAMALLGRKESDSLRIDSAGISKELRIIKVINR